MAIEINHSKKDDTHFIECTDGKNRFVFASFPFQPYIWNSGMGISVHVTKNPSEGMHRITASFFNRNTQKWEIDYTETVIGLKTAFIRAFEYLTSA